MPVAGPVELLRQLAAQLEQCELRWYLFGAQAAVAYGRSRLSEDVDVTVELGAMSSRDLVQRLGAAGFTLMTGVDDEFIRQTRVLPFQHQPTGIPLDIVLAGPGLEELFLGRARELDVGGIIVPVICPEHLIVTKVLAGRPKDQEDVRGILLERGDELDIAEIRELLKALEIGMGQSDLLPLFERLLT